MTKISTLIYLFFLPIKIIWNLIKFPFKRKKFKFTLISLNNFNTNIFHFIYKNARIELYNTDLYDHGMYSYVKNKTRTHNEYISQATAAHVQPIGWRDQSKTLLAHHYTVGLTGEYVYNINNVSEEDLLGLLLSMTLDDSPIVREEFDLLIHSMIDNNYALLNEESKPLQKFGPSVRLTPHKALTILAALKMGSNLGIPKAKSHFKKLKWLGYEVLGSFDTNNSIARYILRKKVYQKKNYKNYLEELVFNMLYLDGREKK